jgi:hypothetical protein
MPNIDTSTSILTGAAAEAETGHFAGAGFGRIDPMTEDPRLLARMDEAAEVLEGALTGRRRPGVRSLQEALVIGDFPLFLNAVLDREMLQRYEDITPVWQQYARRVIVRDFRPKTWVDLMGGKAFLDRVKPGTEYPARSAAEAKYELIVAKYGARYSLLWEDFVNDDLDMLRELPDNLAVAARDTESLVAVSQLVTTTGVNTNFFKTANGNAPVNLDLTRENLENAIIAVTTRKDGEKRPIQVLGGNRRLRLVVPPELALQAEKLVNSTEVRTTVGSEQIIQAGNSLANLVTIVVEPWLSVIATDAKAGKRWFLLPDPASVRPAVAVGFLRGHEAPDLRVKADAGNRINGGAIDPTEGSFDIDAVEYRVRQVIGGATMDPIGTYASNGA